MVILSNHEQLATSIALLQLALKVLCFDTYCPVGALRETSDT